MTTWLEHVKKVHSAGSTSFKESLKRASASWKKTKGAATKKAPKKRRGRKKGKKAAAEVDDEKVEEAPAAPKKKRRRVKKTMPSLPSKPYRNIDSKTL